MLSTAHRMIDKNSIMIYIRTAMYQKMRHPNSNLENVLYDTASESS